MLLYSGGRSPREDIRSSCVMLQKPELELRICNAEVKDTLKQADDVKYPLNGQAGSTG